MGRWLRPAIAMSLILGLLVGLEISRPPHDHQRIRSVPPADSAYPRATEADDGPAGPPNVVVILTDDQRADTLGYMPTVQRELRRKGVRFVRALAPTATCCPSRASLATGLFAHETGVWGNTPPHGGWFTFYENGMEDRTLAKALQDKGYRTGLFGKYANGYAQNVAGYKAGHRPPGWDTFLTFADSTGGYYGYRLTDGSRHGLGAEDYSTDVLGARAARFIRRTDADQPLFVMYTPFGPHKPYKPARRHYDTLSDDMPSYRPPSVREDVRDKPAFLSGRPRVAQRSIDWIRERQQEQLLSVDDAVARILRALRASGRLDNTLIVYMSDNGLMVGDHHTVGKNMPYRFATDVPLIIRWDGHTDRGTTDRQLAANVDVTETISTATGAGMATSGVDLFGAVRRTDVLLEGRLWHRLDGSIPHPAYCGLRTTRYLFVRWADGFEELYDHAVDRYETTNRIGHLGYQWVVDAMRQTTRDRCSPAPPGFTWEVGT